MKMRFWIIGLFWGLGAITAHAQQQLTPAQQAWVMQQQAAIAQADHRRREEEGFQHNRVAPLVDDDIAGPQLAATINAALAEGKQVQVYVLMHDWSYEVKGRVAYERGFLRMRCRFTNTGEFDLVVSPRQVHSMRIYDRG